MLESGLLRAAGVRHGFSLRSGGVSPAPFDSLNLGGAVGDEPGNVAENLSRFGRSLGIGGAAVRTATQVHGDRVVFVRGGGGLTDEAGGDLPGPVEADALLASAGAVVGVRTADCVPVLLFDPRTGLAAAVHAGWRGTFAQIVVRTVEAMARRGGTPSEMLAAIGPAIGPCCYEVGDDLAGRFAGEPSFGPSTVDRSRGRPHLDLWQANRQLLEKTGLSASRVDLLGACTACDAERFFSHRRDAGRTGRHLSAIRAA